MSIKLTALLIVLELSVVAGYLLSSLGTQGNLDLTVKWNSDFEIALIIRLIDQGLFLILFFLILFLFLLILLLVLLFFFLSLRYNE